jgi:hypothetical protein
MNNCACGHPKADHLAVCLDCFRAAPREVRTRFNSFARSVRVEAKRELLAFAAARKPWAEFPEHQKPS